MQRIISIIAQEFGLPLTNVRNTIDLLEGGATVPFISRYRKEATGNMSEVTIEAVLDRLLQLKELLHRKEYILSIIEAQGALTDKLKETIESCWNAAVIEDIYLPYKPKRRNRAEIAKERGLEPLAKIIMAQGPGEIELSSFINDTVADEDAALQGALDIIAGWVNENPRARASLRTSFERTAIITCTVIKGKEEDAKKYRNYFGVKEPLKRCSSHRILAMRRGESEGLLRVNITPHPDSEQRIEQIFVRGNGKKSSLVRTAVHDAYRRLLTPSIENEFASISRHRAELQAIEVFAENLRELLLTPPLGARALMAIDPGIRTGCKVVILDAQGNLLHNDTIFPHASRDKMVYAEMQLLKMIDRYKIKVIAIGSGTAGRETREFIEALEPGEDVDIYMVNEDGASVYSASEVARREFPDYDVTVRGAVSIGRRLMDPLSELVKIDPKSIGIGQYQHDVDQSLLKKKLNIVTESCVNLVGVNVNTAGKELLSYVSGIGNALALSIVNYRKEHGPFRSREELMNVPRLGAKAYEQCAGFLRIPDGDNPLDNSAVHPERYDLVRRMANDLGTDVASLLQNKEARDRIDINRYESDSTGIHTLRDIMAELEKPGRDPRTQLLKFEFDRSISSINDLRVGMILPGKVCNITDFGCFVDLGIKVKGLVHISKLADVPVRDPRKIVHLQQPVRVEIIDIDLDRNRISLSMRGIVQNYK